MARSRLRSPGRNTTREESDENEKRRNLRLVPRAEGALRVDPLEDHSEACLDRPGRDRDRVDPVSFDVGREAEDD